MPTAGENASHILDELQFKYESRGFDFVRNPRRDSLPAFFEGDISDALARKDNETVVIEVKGSGVPLDRRVEAIAERIEREPGYKFSLALALPEHGGDINPWARLEDVRRRLASARGLLEEGDSGGALLLAWSALEAAVRRQLRADTRAVRKSLSASALVSALVAYGLVEEDDKGKLDLAATFRNLIAHGEMNTQPPRDIADYVINLAEALSDPAQSSSVA